MSSGDSATEGRAFPVYCPYCGDEDLRPHGADHGVWECRSCVRVFSLKFVGLLNPSSEARSDHGDAID
jgi:ribosomal protein L37AE/L43A